MGIDAHARERNGCLCCGGQRLDTEPSIISPYFAYKAFGTTPGPCRIIQCRDCDFRFYDRGLTDEEAASYYRGYRDETYFRERNRHEPFYTRKVHDDLSASMASDARRRDLQGALDAVGASDGFDCVIDYGGGDGSLIAEVRSERRISFDPSGTPGMQGIEVISDRKRLPESADLLVCAQTLEHVSDPSGMVSDMASLVRAGGWLYLEVPDQIWRRFTSMSPPSSVVRWLAKRPRALLAADIYGTAFRVKLGFLPPFGFVPMREHINFFTAEALRTLALRNGLEVRAEGRVEGGSLYLIAGQRGDS